VVRGTMIRRALSILSVGLALGCAGAPGAARPAGRELPLFAEAPAPLPSWMRPIVRSQMARHRETLNELRWTAASLEFERTLELARGIAHEVHCGRPADEAVSLGEVIPGRYLELQEELGRRAQQLAQVALGGDTHAVTRAYDGIVDACTRCHAVYRDGPPLSLPTLR
jgi:hypothetical protein